MDGEGGSVSFSCLLASTFDRSAIGRLRLVRAGHQSTTGEQTTLANPDLHSYHSISLSLSLSLSESSCYSDHFNEVLVLVRLLLSSHKLRPPPVIVARTSDVAGRHSSSSTSSHVHVRERSFSLAST